MFFQTHAKALNDYARMSQAIGRRADYVQGGGGNTSVKLDEQRMAIKASGLCLQEIQAEKGYVVVDYGRLQAFYTHTLPASLSDVEKAGAEQIAAGVRPVSGLADLRPSVETGFHAILKRFVVHTHSVYANLAACSTACREIAALAFGSAGYAWGIVPYVNPGASLAFALRDELQRVEAAAGQCPSVILLQNHGMIVHGDSSDICLAIHADANERIAKLFGLHGTSFPQVAVQEMAGGLFAADSPYLRGQLRHGSYTQEALMEKPLYPDQMVFLVDTFQLDSKGIPDGRCVASTKTGEMLMNMEERQALALTQTLAAVLFVMEHIAAAGYTVSSMEEAAKCFISGWESERYRKERAGSA